MIRTSRHNIKNISNKGKISLLEDMYNDFKSDVQTYINYILDGDLPLKNQMSSKLLPTEKLIHSKLKRIAYAEASKIIRSNIKQSLDRRYKKYRQCYAYFKRNNRQLKFLSLKYKDLVKNEIKETRWYTPPVVETIQILLTNELYNIEVNDGIFDEYFNLPTNILNNKGTRVEKVNVPLKHHRQSHKLRNQGFIRRNTIGIQFVDGKLFISLFWEKEDVEVNNLDTKIGIDIGYKKLIAISNGEFHNGNLVDIYKRLNNKVRGSQVYKKVVKERNMEINRIINNIDFDGVGCICIEDINGLNDGNKRYGDFRGWVYKPILEKIEKLSMERGISLVKVSPEYTSQTCSNCGYIHKKSRNGEIFECMSCEYVIDADYNASINIRDRGVYSPSDPRVDING